VLPTRDRGGCATRRCRRGVREFATPDVLLRTANALTFRLGTHRGVDARPLARSPLFLGTGEPADADGRLRAPRITPNVNLKPADRRRSTRRSTCVRWSVSAPTTAKATGARVAVRQLAGTHAASCGSINEQRFLSDAAIRDGYFNRVGHHARMSWSNRGTISTSSPVVPPSERLGAPTYSSSARRRPRGLRRAVPLDCED